MTGLTNEQPNNIQPVVIHGHKRGFVILFTMSAFSFQARLDGE